MLDADDPDMSIGSIRRRSIADLQVQLTSTFEDWPASELDDDGTPFIYGRDVAAVLAEWAKTYSEGEPLLDDEESEGMLVDERFQDLKLRPSDVLDLIVTLKQARAALQPSGPAPEVSNAADQSIDEVESALNIPRSRTTPSQVPLPAPDNDDDDDDALFDPSHPGSFMEGSTGTSSFELVGPASSTPSRKGSKQRQIHPPVANLEKFAFPAGSQFAFPPGSQPNSSHPPVSVPPARRKTTSNPETPPRRKQQHGKVLESSGSVSSIPSSWKMSRPLPASKRRNSQGALSQPGSDTEDFEVTSPHRRIPSLPVYSGGMRSPGLSPQSVGSFPDVENWVRPVGGLHSSHGSVSAPPATLGLTGTGDGGRQYFARNASGEADQEYDMDSFRDLEAELDAQEFAGSIGTTRPTTLNLEEVRRYIRMLQRTLNDRNQHLQDLTHDHYEETRDLREQLEEAKVNVEHMTKEKSDLLVVQTGLREQIFKFELDVSTKQRSIDQKDKIIVKTQKDYQDQLAMAERYRYDISNKDEQLARRVENEKGLDAQLHEAEEQFTALQGRLDMYQQELRQTQAALTRAEEQAHEKNTLEEMVKQLRHDLETERGRVTTAEAALATTQSIGKTPTKRTLLAGKSSLAEEMHEEPTDSEEMTMVDEDGEEADSEATTDADNEVVTQTVKITRLKQRRAPARAGKLPVVEEQVRKFSESGTQCSPSEFGVSADIQTDSTTSSEGAVQTEALRELLSDEPFPTTSLLPARDPATGSFGQSTTFNPRDATETETALERKVLFKWHEHVIVPITGVAKGVSDDAARDWEVLKIETGTGCSVIDHLMEKSQRTGPRNKESKDTKALQEGYESDRTRVDRNSVRIGPNSRALSETTMKDEDTRNVIPSAMQAIPKHADPQKSQQGSLMTRLITTVYPSSSNWISSETSISRYRCIFLTPFNTVLLLSLFVAWTSFLLSYGPILNPLAHYPGISYRDVLLWNSYHQYASQPRYGAYRTSSTSELGDWTRVLWDDLANWLTGG